MTRKTPTDSLITPEFDYNILMDALREYNHPRNKIGDLIKAGEIIRVKKGIYVKAGEPYHQFILANMIFGPSYVSEDSALAFYGLIPERVFTTTCMTTKRRKNFSTPLGEFTYNTLPKRLYPIGIRLEEIGQSRVCLLASPEKSLFDRLWRVKELSSLSATKEYLFESMRVDPSILATFKLQILDELERRSPKKYVGYLKQIIEELRVK